LTDSPRAAPEIDEAAFVALLEPTGELAASTASVAIARLSVRSATGLEPATARTTIGGSRRRALS
jgi:hypothetical protein